eukprot:CAMPEP_0197462248 /NCGR_PEP_ID=MMETSP1175-20131217/58600_1 /TAXON_ID=1003142 /ORGANISM="Triceratium dubium, Strain CCMP147" /LENGTH=104 /DNA_ID=CAMNT_0042997689 /DNA_START=1 /DNA_END=312 /DNA_ORIENTATION=-
MSPPPPQPPSPMPSLSLTPVKREDGSGDDRHAEGMMGLEDLVLMDVQASWEDLGRRAADCVLGVGGFAAPASKAKEEKLPPPLLSSVHDGIGQGDHKDEGATAR